MHITEYARERHHNAHDPTLTAFLDSFHHRILSLFYRAWVVNQKAVDLDCPKEARFPVYIGTFFGIGTRSHCEIANAVPDNAKLHFSGHLACKTRHAEGLEKIITVFFQMPAKVITFVGQWLVLPSVQSMSGRRVAANRRPGDHGYCRLAVLGNAAQVQIASGNDELEPFRRMLPVGDAFLRLKCWVGDDLGQQELRDVQLVLKAEEAPEMRLGKEGLLGWTTWLKSKPFTLDAGERGGRQRRMTKLWAIFTNAPLFLAGWDKLAYKAMESATVLCKMRGDPYVELVHLIRRCCKFQTPICIALSRTLAWSRSRIAADVTASLDKLPRGATAISDFSPHLEEAVERGWLYASLLYSEPRVRTGHMILGILKTPGCATSSRPFRANSPN